MRNLEEQLREDLKSALQSGDQFAVSTLRMLQASLVNFKIESKKKDVVLEDSQVVEIIKKEAKKRKESVSAYRNGGRDDLADKEQSELEFLNRYLPKELSDDEIKKIVKDSIVKIGAKGESEFGIVMKEVMGAVRGRASGDRVSLLVRNGLKSG